MLFYELEFDSPALQEGLAPLGYPTHRIANPGQCRPLVYGSVFHLPLRGIKIRKTGCDSVSLLLCIRSQRRRCQNAMNAMPRKIKQLYSRAYNLKK